ncbi:uncharacterized protein DEA37_0002439, partial [Paragonimus westermani]
IQRVKMCAQKSSSELAQNAHMNTESTPVSYRVTLKMPELMARNYQMQGEPLEQYVYSLKENVKIKNYGCTQNLVKAAIHDQFAVEQSLETLYYNLDEKRLNVKNIKRVLELQTRVLSEKFWRKNISRPLHETWENLEQCSMLLAYHLKAVADYHKFFYDGRLMELDFNRRLGKLIRIGQKTRYIAFNGTLEEVEQLTDCLKTQLGEMEQLTMKAKRFMSRARHIRPIYLRVMPIIKPMNGVLLCDYRTRDVHLKAGDCVTVVSRPEDRQRSGLSSRRYAVPDLPEETSVSGQDRSTPFIQKAHQMQSQPSHALTERVHKTSKCMHWDVRTSQDQKICSVPSIYVDLLIPDLDAREKSIIFLRSLVYIRLYKVLLDTWIDMVNECTVNMCRYFSAVFCGMLKRQFSWHKRVDHGFARRSATYRASHAFGKNSERRVCFIHFVARNEEQAILGFYKSSVMYTDDPALFENFLTLVENLLIELPSDTNDYYDKDLAAQLSYLRDSNKGIRPEEQNVGETTADLSQYEIKQYTELLHWLEVSYFT